MDEMSAKFKRDPKEGGGGWEGLGKDHMIELLHNFYTINYVKTVVWSFYAECSVKSVMDST